MTIEQILRETKAFLTKNKSNSISLFLSKSLAYVISITLGIIGVSLLIYPFFLSFAAIFPFHLLQSINNSDTVHAALGSKVEAQNLVLVVKALIFIIGLLLVLVSNYLLKLVKKDAVLKEANTLLEKWLLTNAPEVPLKKDFKLETITPKDLPLE